MIQIPRPFVSLYISATGDYKKVDYSGLYMRLWGEIKRQGLFSAGIEHLALYLDCPEITAAENL